MITAIFWDVQNIRIFTVQPSKVAYFISVESSYKEYYLNVFIICITNPSMHVASICDIYFSYFEKIKMLILNMYEC